MSETLYQSFDSSFTFHFSELKEGMKTTIEEDEIRQEVHVKELYIDRVMYRMNNQLISQKIPDDPEIGPHNMESNAFLDDCVEKLMSVNRRYKSRPVYQFFAIEFPKLVEKHRELMTKDAKRYKHYSQAMDKVNHVETARLLGEWYAYKKFVLQYFKKDELELNQVSDNVLVEWTNKGNTTDFVKLVYGIHKAKLINNGDGEITKILVTLGKAFNLEIDLKKMSSNLSKSKHHVLDREEQAKVFNRIKEAYLDYWDEELEKMEK